MIFDLFAEYKHVERFNFIINAQMNLINDKELRGLDHYAVM